MANRTSQDKIANNRYLMMLEILNGFLVRLSRVSCREGPEISTFAGLGIFLTRVQAILSRFQFPNHK